MAHYLCWMKTINGIGNIIGSSYNENTSPQWESPSTVTNDSTGKNLPIIASLAMHIPVYKTFQSLYFYYHYLVFIRTLNDSNAFVRVNNRNFDSRRDYWTKNQIIDIDAQPGDIVYSAWVESDSSLYTVFYHAGRAYPDAVKDDPPIPSRFSLEQNYPNPFNPSTTIQYSIPSSVLVTLEIFDILGRKIITLINNRRQSSGSHQLQWDANEFPSGIYFYRLKCNTTVTTKKMLLIR